MKQNGESQKLINFGPILKNRAFSLLIIIAALFLVISIVYPSTFGTWDNFATILLNMSAEIMILIAISLLLLNGEIDLSLGSIMVFAAILCGLLLKQAHLPMILAILIPIGLSMLLGFVNGFIVARLQVPSFIGTLATGMIFNGIAIKIAGTGWTDFPDVFTALGQGKLFGLQLPVYYMIIAVALFTFFVSRTRYFRQYYYIGGNQKAAVLSGINIEKTKIIVFIIAAVLASLGGIVSAMRFNSALPSVGAGVELRAVTAAVVGGISFTGGEGTMLGAAFGALFIAMLNNILTILNVSPDLQFCIIGVVLILAIWINIIADKRRNGLENRRGK